MTIEHLTLKELRIRSGLSLRKAGAAIGRVYSTVWHWEEGMSNPRDIFELGLLLNVYGLHPRPEELRSLDRKLFEGKNLAEIKFRVVSE